MADKQTSAATREENRLSAGNSPQAFRGPGRWFDRFADEMDRIFDDFGFGQGLRASRFSGSGLRSPWRGAHAPGSDMWAPDIEMFQRNHELVVRADLPGLRKEDVWVEVTDDALHIHGERRQEDDSEHLGVYRSERSYGSFSRVIRLPEGTITDQAKASFKDGVMEITMPAPPEQVTRGRRLEIKGADENKK